MKADAETRWVWIKFLFVGRRFSSVQVIYIYIYLVYTKTVDSVFRALWLATQSVNILHHSLIRLQFLQASDAKPAWDASKMLSRFAAVTNQEISQLIKQAISEIHEEGDEVRFGSFNR